MLRSSVLLGIFAIVFPVGFACAAELEIPLTVVTPEDPFTTQVLLEGEPADWPFLADGSSQLGIADNARLVYYENAYPCSPGEVFGTLTGATLIVTFDTTVPTETRPWGTIKGIYR